MDDPAAMRFAETSGELMHDRRGAIDLERRLAFDELLKRRPAEELRHEKGESVGCGPEVDDADDVLVRDPAQRLRLAPEPSLRGLLRGEALDEHLHRALPLEHRVARAIDDRGDATSDPLDDPVA